MGATQTKARRSSKALMTCSVCRTQILRGCPNAMCRRDCRSYGKIKCKRHNHNGKPRYSYTPGEARSQLFSGRQGNPTYQPPRCNESGCNTLTTVQCTNQRCGDHCGLSPGARWCSAHNPSTAGSSRHDSTGSLGSGTRGSLSEMSFEDPRSMLINFTRPREDIWVAARSNNIPEVKRHLEEGADINGLDLLNNSPLFYASQGGHTDMVRELLNCGARDDVNTRRCWWNARNMDTRKLLDEHYQEQMRYNEMIAGHSTASASGAGSEGGGGDVTGGTLSTDEAIAQAQSSRPPATAPNANSADEATLDTIDELIAQVSTRTFSEPSAPMMAPTDAECGGKGKQVSQHERALSEPQHVAGAPAGTAAMHADTVAHYEKAMRDLTEQNICKICFECAIDVVFVPCGHLGFCNDCTESLRHCPVCRKDIGQRLTIYRV
eukprot:TRINITY_DN2872_c0_g1_i4.p1 TRINITY_DN2872_c0_g1~~TRINITY_DN2872_c0_g1_i4.p1  ORF type:complete len:435 (+),score=18.58 TRINITY_DN2872_c0_g1_i4:174-1478(+)